MKKEDHKKHTPVAITLACPNCDYQPEHWIFSIMPLTNYSCNYPDKLMQVRCPFTLCGFSGTIIEWTRIIFE